MKRSYVCLGIPLQDAHIRPGHTRGRVPVDGFYEDVLVCQAGQLLFHQRQVFLTRTYIYILFGKDFAETVDRGLEHGSPCTKEIHKLFRIGIPTGWPQAPPPSSRENHAESSIVFYVHEIDLVTYSVRRYEI